MRNKKILSMLLAVVISLGIWLYVVLVENPEKTATLYNIPVTFSGEDVLREDYDLIIGSTNVESGVTLDFRGRLSELNKLRDDKSELEVVIDVSRLRTASEQSFTYDLSDITLPASVSSQNLSLIGRVRAVLRSDRQGNHRRRAGLLRSPRFRRPRYQGVGS